MQGAQPVQGDRDEPANPGVGRQYARRREGIEAIPCKLVGRDIVPDIAGLCSLGQQVSNQVVTLLLGPDDVLASMQESLAT